MEGHGRQRENQPTTGGDRLLPGAIDEDPRPDPEVPEKPIRRRFTAACKLAILEEADQCTRPGELAALLQRGGLYLLNLGT